jgi:hypothetical protein
MNYEKYQPCIRNLLKDVPSHLLQSSTPDAHLMLISLANYTRAHPMSSTFRMPPNSPQLKLSRLSKSLELVRDGSKQEICTVNQVDIQYAAMETAK